MYLPKPKSFLDVEKEDIQPLNQSESENMFMVMLSEKRQDNEIVKKFEEYSLYQILNHRLKLPFDDSDKIAQEHLRILLSLLSKTPGEAVLWAYTILHIYNKEKRQVKIDDFAKTYFPWGIPNKEAMSSIWGCQKGYVNGLLQVDNILDLSYIYKTVPQGYEAFLDGNQFAIIDPKTFTNLQESEVIEWIQAYLVLFY